MIKTYFDGDKKSPWYLVAFGMIGSGISAVSLVSILAMWATITCIIFSLSWGPSWLPLHRTGAGAYLYHHRVVSLYSYLGDRFGTVTYKTGSLFFYRVAIVWRRTALIAISEDPPDAFLDPLGVPYPVSIVLILFLIWLYTHRSG